MRERERQSELQFEHAESRRRGPDPTGTTLYAIGLLASSFAVGMALTRRLRQGVAPVRVDAAPPRGAPPARRRRRR
jgi:hypothetical protein